VLYPALAISSWTRIGEGPLRGRGIELPALLRWVGANTRDGLADHASATVLAISTRLQFYTETKFCSSSWTAKRRKLGPLRSRGGAACEIPNAPGHAAQSRAGCCPRCGFRWSSEGDGRVTRALADMALTPSGGDSWGWTGADRRYYAA